MKLINEVRLEFPSCSANEGFARSAAACFAAQMDPTLEELGDIRTAVSEAVTNAIVHGYPDSLGRVITLRMRIYGGSSSGAPGQRLGASASPMWSRPVSPMYTTGGEERSGMGFTIMESFMDGLEGDARPRGSGTTVTMRKRIARRTNA